MCGRYVVDEDTIDILAGEVGAEWRAPRPEARYNIAPTDPVLASDVKMVLVACNTAPASA